MRRRHGAHDPHEVATVHGTKTLRPTVPRAASLKISRRVCGMLVSIVLVFFMADHILIGRLFRNPLLVFCLCLSLVSFVVSVLFPRDDSISRPVVVAVFVTWCIMCIRISATDWDQRPHEPSTRTALRRFVCVTWTSCTVMTTLAYISELLVSSWATIRAIFIISAGMDVVHTACIHLLYTIDPLNQPTKPIFHTSGVRVGPPTITSYLGPLYILVVVSLLNARRREAISRFTGGSTLSIGLGQLRAEELSSLQKPTTSARAQGANGGIASSSSSQDNSPPEALRQAVLAAVRSIDTRCQSYDCVELNSGELRSRLEEITEAKARLDEARLILEVEQRRLERQLQARLEALTAASDETQSSAAGRPSSRRSRDTDKGSLAGSLAGSSKQFGGSTCGTNSELAEMFSEEDLLELEPTMHHSCTVRPPSEGPAAAGSPAALRMEALWSTLERCQIVLD